MPRPSRQPAPAPACTRISKIGSGANSVIGSRFPCTAQPYPTARQPSSSGVRQSSPITSAPVSAHRRQQTRRLHAKVDHRHAHLLHRAHQPLRHRQTRSRDNPQPTATPPSCRKSGSHPRPHPPAAGIRRQHRHHLVQQLPPRIRVASTSSSWSRCNSATRRPRSCSWPA